MSKMMQNSNVAHSLRQMPRGSNWLSISWLVAALACCACCLGCGQPLATKTPANLVQVAGRVTLNNQPLTRASVLFLPIESGSRARGMTNANGEFHLLDESELAGIAPGEYLIVFKPLTLLPGESTQPLDKDYQSPDSTPVRATVSEDTELLNFQLTNRASAYRIKI